MCTSLFTYYSFSVGLMDGGKLFHPAELCRISTLEDVADLDGMNVRTSSQDTAQERRNLFQPQLLRITAGLQKYRKLSLAEQ